MTSERAGAVLSVRGTVAAALGMTVFPMVSQLTGRPPHMYAAWVDAHLDAFR